MFWLLQISYKFWNPLKYPQQFAKASYARKKSNNQSINQSAHLQVHKQFNMETLNWERCSRSARSKSKCTQIQKSQEKLIPTLQKLGHRTNNLSRTLHKLQDKKRQNLSQDHCKNLDNHKQSLKITITDKRETGKKTKPISQDHHHDCRFSWSTKEESATTCEP